MLSDLPPQRICTFALLLLGAVLPAAMGCRSRAQQDLYQQKMIREVRILEDKLYEADYKNRALSEKLKRARIEASEVQIHSAKPARRPAAGTGNQSFPGTNDLGPASQGNALNPAAPEKQKENNIETSPSDATEDEIGLSDLLPPTFDEGEPIEPDALEINGVPPTPDPPSSQDPIPLTDPPTTDSPEPITSPTSPELPPSKPDAPDTTPASPPPASLNLPSILDDPSEEKSTPEGSREKLGLPDLEPAPGGPEPPGIKDTEIPPVLPGETLPPQFDPKREQLPPGQIELPDSVKSNQRVPETIQIHPTLSGVNRTESQVQDLLLVVNVVNDLGKTIDLNDFLIDAEMSVVVLDPKRDAAVARLGRWDFQRDQVTGFVKSEPVSGFHVPLEWTMDQPLGSEILVHVRLRAEDDEMRCEAKLNIQQARGVTGWLPRVESLR